MALRARPSRDSDWFDWATEIDAIARRVDAVPVLAKQVALTQTQYDALATKDATTLYVITGN